MLAAALSKLKSRGIFFVELLEALNQLSNENEFEFNNHFYSHYSHEFITEKITELLKAQFPENLDEYFKGRFSTACKMQPLVKKLYHFAPKQLNIKQQTLSDYIKRLKQIGVIICLDKTATFETEKTQEKYANYVEFQGYCKYYLCNKDRCKSLLDYCYSRIDSKDNKNVSITEDKQGIITTEILSEKFDLKKNYFGINRIQMLSIMEELNKDLPDYEKMTLSEEKEFSRIYCPFCSLPTEEHFSKKRLELQRQYHDTYTREDYLESFNTEFRHWDRKASVPFITRLINKNIITPNDYDLYKDLNGEEFKGPEERNAYKTFFMRLYFCKSRKQCISQAIYAWNEWFYGVPTKKGFKGPTLYKWLTATGDIKLDDRHKNNLRNARAIFLLCIKSEYEKNKNLTKEQQEQLIKDYVEKKFDLVEKVLGKRIGKEVFMYESALYLQVRQIAKQKNIEVKQCYDSFYFDKDKEFDVMKVISGIIENLNSNQK